MKPSSKKAAFIIFYFITAIALHAEDWGKVKMAIEKMNNRLEKALVTNNEREILTFYTSDAISLPDYEPALKGIDQIKDNMEKQKADGFKYHSVDFTTTDIIGSGDLAVEIGKWDVTFSLPGSTQKINDNGKYITVWEKQSDGSWKTKVETWNTDTFPVRETREKEMSGSMSETEKNKAIVTRFNKEFIEGGSMKAFDEIVSKDFINRTAPPGVPMGPEGVLYFFNQLIKPAFPDLKVTILDQVAEGDKVTTKKIFEGTQKGEFFGMPASNKKVVFDVIDIIRLKDGKFVEHWNVLDMQTVMAQITAK